MKYLLNLPLLFLLCNLSSGQSTEVPLADTLRKDALNVYMDDVTDYIKREIPYINYVRDFKDADVIIIYSVQSSGSGGNLYTYFLEGQKRFEGRNDTLYVSSSPDDTQDKTRESIVLALKQGLMQYVARTPLAKYVTLSFTEPMEDNVSSDKWNNWVFRTSLNGYAFGQDSGNDLNVFGNISASKTTDNWKMYYDADYSFEKSEYDLGDEILITEQISKSLNALVVKSLNDHWSVGGSAKIFGSIRNNYDLKFEIMPGIEYDIFPYSESTSRQLRILYSAGFVYNDYIDSTQYDMLEESLAAHRISASYEMIKKWGSIDISVSWFNYIPEWKKNNLRAGGSLNFRILKGLSLNFGGNYSFIADQISLRKEEASDTDIITGTKEVATSFSYFTHFGLSYTFGSIYNNVVNPRFGSRGGRTIIIN